MHIKKTSLLLAAFFCCTTALPAQIQVDAEKERPMIERRLDEYSKYLLEGDSVSLAAMYAQNAAIGCKKGPEILAAMGGWVRNGIKNNSRHVVFKTSSLTADGELLSEIGTAESRSDQGELKYTFRYLVVWKKENGTWKLYRDVAL
jgi:ketosteroid isomerase-like protein